MNRFLSLAIAASIGLSAAPALAEDPPQAAAPPAAPPAAMYAPPPGYVPWGWEPGAYRPPPPTERNSAGMMATGIVFVSAGSIAVFAGLGVYQTKSSCIVVDLPPGGPFPDRCPGDSHHFVGSIVMIAGGIGAALGIPLLIVGARRVPVDAAPATSRAPTLLVGPTSAALRFMF
jgi:hypothetical protein